MKYALKYGGWFVGCTIDSLTRARGFRQLHNPRGPVRRVDGACKRSGAHRVATPSWSVTLRLMESVVLRYMCGATCDMGSLSRQRRTENVVCLLQLHDSVTSEPKLFGGYAARRCDDRIVIDSHAQHGGEGRWTTRARSSDACLDAVYHSLTCSLGFVRLRGRPR